MVFAIVTVFGDDAGEVQVADGNLQAGFFADFTHGAFVGGFAFLGVKFSPDGAPEAPVRLLSSVQQEQVSLLVEQVDEGGDFVPQLHWEPAG
jgi:hypothetical protein